MSEDTPAETDLYVTYGLDLAGLFIHGIGTSKDQHATLGGISYGLNNVSKIQIQEHFRPEAARLMFLGHLI